MSRIFVCFFVLFIFNIAIRFGDCEDNTTQPDTDCNQNVTLGSDTTHLSKLEEMLKGEWPINITKNKRPNNSSKNGESFGKILEKYLNKVLNIPLIAPGTLWCGSGDIARNESDLGIFNKTDACCRAHDNCKNDLLAGETEVNLKNNGIFTRSACICDNQFYNCLKKAESLIANSIGHTYFNVLRPQCFSCVCPEDCPPENDTECKDHCTKYKWIDNKKF